MPKRKSGAVSLHRLVGASDAKLQIVASLGAMAENVSRDVLFDARGIANLLRSLDNQNSKKCAAEKKRLIDDGIIRLREILLSRLLSEDVQFFSDLVKAMHVFRPGEKTMRDEVLGAMVNLKEENPGLVFSGPQEIQDRLRERWNLRPTLEEIRARMKIVGMRVTSNPGRPAQ